MIKWPLRTGTNTNIWKQTSNPMAPNVYPGIEGYEAISENFNSKNWGGLEYNSRNDHSLLDGSVNNDRWYYAIGSSKEWGGAIPGAKDAEQVVELYVFVA